MLQLLQNKTTGWLNSEIGIGAGSLPYEQINLGIKIIARMSKNCILCSAIFLSYPVQAHGDYFSSEVNGIKIPFYHVT